MPQHDFMHGFEQFDLEVDDQTTIHGVTSGKGRAVG
jgi:hypothetical protein